MTDTKNALQSTVLGFVPVGTVLPCMLDCTNEEIKDYLEQQFFFVCNGQPTPHSAHDFIKSIFKTNLPDLREKTLVGANDNNDRTSYHLHKTGGNESQSVSWDNLIEKQFNTFKCFDSYGSGSGGKLPLNCTDQITVSLGKQDPDKLNIMQPFYCVNYIIYVGKGN